MPRGSVSFGFLAAAASVAVSFQACGGKTDLLLLGGPQDAGGSSGSVSGSSSGPSSSSSGSSSSTSGSSSGVSSSSGGSSSGTSSSTGGSSSGTSSSTSGSSGGTSSSTGSGSGSSSSSGGVLLDAGTNPQGVIYLQECVDPTICGQTGGYVYADFDPMGSPVTDGCTVTSYGACAWWACSNPTTPGVSAGALAVTGGTLTSSLNVPFMGTSYTYTGSLYFASGDVVSVTAAGGVVSPFGPLSVTAPSTLTLTKPTLGGALTISTATDLSVAWTGGQAGNLAFVEGAASNGQSFFLCEWDGATGIGVVPQAVLAPLKGQTGAAFVYGQEANATPIVVGLYTVSLQAAVYGGSSATFQ